MALGLHSHLTQCTYIPAQITLLLRNHRNNFTYMDRGAIATAVSTVFVYVSAAVTRATRRSSISSTGSQHCTAAASACSLFRVAL
jgi:hypothetical protein